MAIPAEMTALAVIHDGYSGTAEGPSIKALEPYVELRRMPVPKPDKRQVLIKVALANINPSDLHFIKGEYGRPRVANVPAGMEGCGTVVAAGEGAEGLVGKRVAFTATRSGSWAEYALTEAGAVVPVGEGIKDTDAAAFFVNPLTAIAMIGEVKDAGAKSFIMSAAASQLCKLMAGLARDEGLEAIALVRRDEHVAHLKELGAAHVLNTASPGFKADMASVMKSAKPGVMLDAVADQLCSDLFFAMPPGAQWVIYGKLSPEPPVLSQAGQFIFMDKHIRGFWLTKWMVEKPRETVMAAGAKVAQMFESGAWATEVADTIPLAEAHARLPKALAGANMGKVMLKP